MNDTICNFIKRIQDLISKDSIRRVQDYILNDTTVFKGYRISFWKIKIYQDNFEFELGGHHNSWTPWFICLKILLGWLLECAKLGLLFRSPCKAGFQSYFFIISKICLISFKNQLDISVVIVHENMHKRPAFNLTNYLLYGYLCI